jgi:hypothetical protein
VTVKAHPVIGKRTGESVCVAGVRLDGRHPSWIRLFPVPFRSLSKDVQFKKYAVVQLRVQPSAGTHRRPESYKPDLDSLRVGSTLSTHRRWADRWAAMGALAGATTACALHVDAKERSQDAPSPGLVKPADVIVVSVDDNPRYRPGTSSSADVDLFGNEIEALQAQPFIVKLRYRCEAPGCRTHEQTVVDWEAGQLGRRLLLVDQLPRDRARAHVRQKYLEMCAPTRDTYFYLGNQHQHPASFLVLGLFWPPARSRPLLPDLTLF